MRSKRFIKYGGFSQCELSALEVIRGQGFKPAKPLVKMKLVPAIKTYNLIQNLKDNGKDKS